MPSHFSLRDKMPAIWQQGHIGSCSAHGTAAAYVTDLMRQGFPVYMPARLFIYYNGRALFGDTAADLGCSIRDVIKGVATWGAPDENLWPYSSAVTHRPSDAAYAAGKQHLALSYAPVVQSMDAIKTAIFQGYPVVFGIMCYAASFEHGAVQRTGMMEMPGLFDVPIAGHCICAIGWNSKNYLEIRNSWGPHWGDNGYMWMPQAFVENPRLASDFWVIKSVMQ